MAKRKKKTSRKRGGRSWTVKGRVKRRLRKAGRAAGRALSKL